MKKVILMLAILISVIQLSAQSISYEDISEAAKRPKGKFVEYVASNGEMFNVGETILIASPSSKNDKYEYILEMSGMSVNSDLGLDIRGWEAEIIKFQVFGTKRMGFFVKAICKTEIGLSRYHIEIEKCLKYGEIVSNVLTSDQALEKLLKAKKLLELDMLTQEEFDTLKSELAEIIKQ